MYLDVLRRFYAAGGEYRHIAVLKGDTVLMWCNTTKSGGVNWTRNTTAGHFSYVYINGNTTEGNIRYSVVEHSLRIYNAQIRDTGRYDCYDSGDVRRFGYELNVTGQTTLTLSLTFDPLSDRGAF